MLQPCSPGLTLTLVITCYYFSPAPSKQSINLIKQHASTTITPPHSRRLEKKSLAGKYSFTVPG